MKVDISLADFLRLFFLLAGGVVLIFLLFYLFVNPSHKPPLLPTLSFGMAHGMNDMVIVGIKKKFFQEEGLQLKVMIYPTGKMVLQGMLAGEVDFGIVGLGEYWLLFQHFMIYIK
ncbi:MAG: hypothetical protein H7832_07125 [Magnetococcus sp. DMHC-6]